MDLLGLADLPFLPSIVTRAEVPEDIGAVETVDSKAEVDPLSVGIDPAAVDEIWAAALRWYRTGIHPALSICVRVRGQILMRRSLGWSHGGGPDDAAGTPKVKATPETPFNIFSASKPMAAMVVHLLDQRHLVHLDDPVCEYIPEFHENGKEHVTIRHVLTHRAGIPLLPEAAFDLGLLEDIDNREAIRMLCEATPLWRAGGRLAYHAVTGGLLIGEIVRRVTGRNIRQVVDEEFCKPFGWRWMNYGVRRKDVPKVATSHFTGLPLVPPLSTLIRRVVLGVDFVKAVQLSNDPRYLMGVLPAANLIATADELCQFYQMLLDGGSWNGHRLFDPRTVIRATAEQSYGELDFTLGVPLRYGMGFMLGGEWLSLYGFDTTHAFGHLGLTNIVAWADPKRHLTCAIMTSGKPVLYPELHRSFQLVHAITNACPKDDSVPPPPVVPQRPRKKKARAVRGESAKAKRSKAGREEKAAAFAKKVKTTASGNANAAAPSKPKKEGKADTPKKKAKADAPGEKPSRRSGASSASRKNRKRRAG